MMRTIAATLAMPWLLGCDRSPPAPSPAAAIELPAGDPAPAGDREPARDAATAPPGEGEPLQLLTDPRVLAVLDRDAASPWSLHAVLARVGPAPRDAPSGATTGAMLAAFQSTWGAVADVVAADVARVVEELAIDWEDDITRTYDRSAARTAVGGDADHRGNGNVARVLRASWLRSPDARFPLAALVYRPDRRDFVGGCGELRAIYRLAYEIPRSGGMAASRLPLTINVVFAVPDDGEQCRSVARRWRAPAIDDANAEAVAAALLQGPLRPDAVRFAQLELDAQLVRFPSDLERVDRRDFAGQALYLLRIFALRGDVLRPIPLENTPDVEGIRADPARREALRRWLLEHMAEVDLGVFQLPEPLLADVALSYSTLGHARLANRPFSALLQPQEADALVAEAGLAAPRFVADGRSLLERLDAASCMGCHQLASTAGFHLLGVDRPFGDDPGAVMAATDGNRLQLAISPHLLAELPRRRAYLDALADGRAPDRFRPHPAAPPATWTAAPVFADAGSNAPCLRERDGTATLAAPARWRCAPPLRCSAMVDDAQGHANLGMCLPEQAQLHAGEACRDATIEAATAPGRFAWNLRAFEDRVTQQNPRYALGTGAITTRAYNCRPAHIGVPLGRVTRNCRADERTLAAVVDQAEPSELCAVVGGRGFEAMATGVFDHRAFADSVVRGMLDACDAVHPCREDYICQALPEFLASKGVAAQTLAALQRRGLGFCTPTYFVYQLRLDGHPNPR
ncbi:MAG: hypothetical protein K1X88_17505 [Nannocystaceae bacterium]|nr:hypothetical protein [Nannocystaceae bacterium]